MYLFNTGLNKYKYCKCCAFRMGMVPYVFVVVIVVLRGVPKPTPRPHFGGPAHAWEPMDSWVCLPYRTMHYQCMVAHALHSFRSHDGYMWACLPRYPHSSGDSSMSRSPAPDTLSVLRFTVTCHVHHNT